MKKAFIINGPNINMLGRREEGVYGTATFEEVKETCQERADLLKFDLDFSQSNSEGTVIDKIHQAVDAEAEGIIINAGAYTHTSIAIGDALKIAVFNCLKVVEVHISNVYSRESFRHKSYVSPVADALICGAGEYGYIMALDYLASPAKKLFYKD